MIQKMRNRMSKCKDNRGFTLVEMALVLIIIGIIIGAIVKGKDLVRSAEMKRIYSKFLNEWRLGYLNFYDRTGKILGDQYDAAGAAEGQDGQADTNDTGAAPDDPGRGELDTGDTDGTVDYLGLDNVGLEAPTTNTGSNFTYNYVNSLGSTNILTIAFDWDGVNNYNYMEIQNIPAELAMAIDTMIDGEADGTGPNGDFQNGDGSADWPTTATAPCTARWRMKF